MIENISEEKLQEILQNVVLPDSNIGVHNMTVFFANNYTEAKKVYDEILDVGFVCRGGEKAYHGIISHVAMCGLNNDYIADKVLAWDFGLRKNEGIKIIFAIPSIIISNNKEYYIGEYPQCAAENIEAESITYGMSVHRIPKEFILGHLKIKYISDNQGNAVKPIYDFVLNNNYIGIKSEEEKKQFFDTYEETLKNKLIFTLDERGYKMASAIKNESGSSIFGDTYYVRKFFNKYDELNKGERKL